jgi:hypothetical protein
MNEHSLDLGGLGVIEPAKRGEKAGAGSEAEVPYSTLTTHVCETHLICQTNPGINLSQ